MAELDRQDIERQQKLWLDNWAKKMTEIWQDKLEFWHIYRTGALMSSFDEDVRHDNLSANILLRFLAYGVYQAYGTGYGYNKNNGGDLPFLDEAYRREHYLDKPRKVGPEWGGYYTSGDPREKRDWFSPKLFGSLMKLRETMAHMIGEDAAAVICEALENAHKSISK